MKIICGIRNIPPVKKGVIALGVFDGVHRAHTRILKEAVRWARRIRGKSIAFTFYPHPQAEESLYSLAHRLRLIAELKVQLCIVVKFNPSFSKISAEKFVKEILVRKFGLKAIFVGRNFRFGRGAAGDFTLLKKLGGRFGFRVKGFDAIKRNGRAISSTLIRSCIKKGDLAGARDLLGRPVSILGTVIRGSSLARRLGYPTANISAHHEVIPPAGIYAVRINLSGRKLKGACYIGTRPTFSGRNKTVHIEVHIFSFRRNIYARSLEIQFVRKIRPDKLFSSPQLLAAAIKKDIACAKRALALH